MPDDVSLEQYDLVYPLRHFPDRVEPFPTIYYLTDPDLLRAISELERQNFIGKFEQRLADDDALRAAYHTDHERYRDTRWAMLTDADRQVIEQSASLSRSFRGGIAGIANVNTVKCLHAHYAHHLATVESGGTVIGQMIDEQLGMTE
ncbi:MAG: DUF501 domain-containing protein [Planctomycetota bacterium]